MTLWPVRMEKVGFIGLRDDQERILTLLHDLRVAQVEPLSPATMAELAPERGSETLRHVGDEALRFRGLLSALPAVGPVAPRRFDSLADVLAATRTVPIDDEVGALKREDDRLVTEEKGIRDVVALLDLLSFYPERLEYLRSANLLSFYGEATPEGFTDLRAAVPPAADALVIPGPRDEESVRFLIVLRSSGADALSRTAQAHGVRLTVIPPLSGTPAEERARLVQRQREIAARRAEIATRLRAIASEWYPTVATIYEALEVENRKSELLSMLGASRAAFALEAWVPARDVARLEAVVQEATGGRAYFYKAPATDEPPTIMANPRGVRRFEFFIRFYSLPQASEWDPTMVFAIVFPLFFGLMLGDWGYGLVILLVSLWMVAGFPGARYLPRFGRNFMKMIMGPKGMQQLAYALLPGCALAIGIGLFWDEFFGFHLFGALFGYVAPIDPMRKTTVAALLLLAGYIGLGMVVLGFLFGAIKEYLHRHPRGVIGKSGGILLAVGVAFVGLSVIHRQDSFTANPPFDAYLALLAVGLVLLLAGEGFQMGLMGLIEVVSHILSYTRLVGILLASVILAFVINSIGSSLVIGGTVVGIVAGLVIIVVGQSFNVIVGVFEPGIQGARLIFVEYFSKFYTGNGRPFRPFGAVRTHTVSSVTEEGALAGPILRGPTT